jgi:hypothetical protein
MRTILVIAVSACALCAAADAPYAGKWKMNLAKSNFGETTVTYEQLSGGQIRATMDNQSYTFRTDGTDAKTPWGFTLAWKPVDSTTWQTTEKTNGKVTATGTVKLSPDGKTLSMESKRSRADGGTFTDSITFERVSGTSGLAGKWKTKNLKSSSPETMTLTQKGSDGLTIASGNMGAVCDARFDGRDHPATGPMWPSGWSCSIARNGERGLDVTWKKDGKAMYGTSLVVSGDGRTLTESGSAVGANEKFTVVYDRI